MCVRVVLLALTVGAAALAGCGGGTAAAPPTATAPACHVVVARTLRTITTRIEARAALHRSVADRVPTLVARLTRPAPHACGARAAATVAETIGVVGERLVHAEATGPEAAQALRLVARDPRFVRAVRRRDAAALRTAIVRFFRIKRL